MQNNHIPYQYIIITVLLFFCSFAKNTLSKDIDSDKITKNTHINTITIDQINQNNLANVAVLQGLNKITAKTLEFEININDQFQFGKLTIIAHQCWQSPPDQKPESKILLEIYETGSDDIKNKIFYGWMFASSPSISGLEHPIYDITALSCLFR